ncbi:MAG: hypothetical protein QNJ51_29070 [Calothrix sp. MO_167.B12]|nr:hypothetical protein [Calothrix sp. MO_167.B12]
MSKIAKFLLASAVIVSAALPASAATTEFTFFSKKAHILPEGKCEMNCE